MKTFIICGPSGVGKGTLIRNFLKKYKNFSLVTSHTNRKMRQGEINGVDYHFVSTIKFNEMVSNKKFLEWEKTHGNLYGTSLEALNNRKSENLILEIDIKGAQNIYKNFNSPEMVFIFITTNFEELEKRIKGRGQDDEKAIKTRLKTAKEEMKKFKEVQKLKPPLFSRILESFTLEQDIKNFEKLLLSFV